MKRPRLKRRGVKRPRAARGGLHAARRAALLAAVAGGGLFATLWLGWFHYKAEGGHEFDAKGWVTFTNMDIHLAITGGLTVIASAVALFGFRRWIAPALGVLALLALITLVQRLIARPYAENFISVTPRIGVILATLATLVILGASLRIHPYGAHIRRALGRVGGVSGKGLTFLSTRNCPACGELIPGWRRECPNCGHRMAEEPSGTPPAPASKPPASKPPASKPAPKRPSATTPPPPPPRRRK